MVNGVENGPIMRAPKRAIVDNRATKWGLDVNAAGGGSFALLNAQGKEKVLTLGSLTAEARLILFAGFTSNRIVVEANFVDHFVIESLGVSIS